MCCSGEGLTARVGGSHAQTDGCGASADQCRSRSRSTGGHQGQTCGDTQPAGGGEVTEVNKHWSQ